MISAVFWNHITHHNTHLLEKNGESLSWALALGHLMEAQLLAANFFLVAAFLQEDLVHISSLLLILGPRKKPTGHQKTLEACFKGSKVSPDLYGYVHKGFLARKLFRSKC